MNKIAIVFGQGHHFRSLLNLLGSFFHFARFLLTLTFFRYSVLFFVFSFLILRYIPRQLRHVIVAENFLVTTSRKHKLLLGNLRTNRERLILLSSQPKVRKNTHFIDQSAFSNFAFYVVHSKITSRNLQIR